MPINLRHIGIVTKNLEKSLEFYRDLLGFKIKTEAFENKNFIDHILNLKNTSLKTVKLIDNNAGIIEFLSYDNPKRQVNQKRNKRFRPFPFCFNGSEFGRYIQ